MKKIKKIIFFYPAYENGGATKNLQNLINYFCKKKINVHLVSINAKYENFSSEKKFLKISNPKNLIKYRLLPLRLNYTFSCIKILKEIIRNSEKKNTIVFSLQSHLPCVLTSRFLKTTVVIRNSEDPFGATRFADERVLSFFVFLSKFLSFNLSNGIITNSTKSMKAIGFFLINKKKLRIIYNPYLKNLSKKTKIKAKNYIFSAGRFCKQKNFLFLIDTISKLKIHKDKISLILIGDGPQKKQMLTKIRELKLTKFIKIRPWKNNLQNIFKKAKIFILPSLYEGQPNILIDAINHGIPSISSNCSGAQDILGNNKGSEIFPINNQNRLIHYIKKIISNYDHYKDKAEINRLKASRFLIEPQSKKYLLFLQKIHNN